MCSREAAARKGGAAVSAAAQAHLLAELERYYISRAAVVTTAGWGDALALQNRGIAATWIPVPIEVSKERSTANPDRGKPTAGFIGNFDYWPNRHALETLYVDWLPFLRNAGWDVLVAGRGSGRLQHPPDGVRIVGEVDTVSEFYSSVDLSLAPINLGGGMKVKVIESLMHGTMVAATSFALDGFPPAVRNLCHVISRPIADLPDIEALAPITATEINWLAEMFSYDSVAARLRQTFDLVLSKAPNV
ncbi:glycosyltransferase family 4 protein [Williamsia sp. M5A3_1d]